MTPRHVLPAFALLFALCGTVSADTVQLTFQQGTDMYLVARKLPGPITPEVVLGALLAGPTANEQASGVYSQLPAGTRIVSFSADGTQATVDFSSELLAHLSERTLESIFRQVSWTLRPFGYDDLSLTVQGTLLSEYLPKPPAVKPVPRKDAQVTTAAGALSGHSITLSPGHGWVWSGGAWGTQRPVYCSPLSEEDFHNLEICQYLQTYLWQDGMNVRPVRCFDKTTGNCSYSAKPWWQMGANAWLQYSGYPCSVFAPDSHDCTVGSGPDEHSDDVWSRPLASDMDGSDIYISVHTNGYGGNCTGSGCPTGTETYYDAGSEHAPWGAVSQALADNVSNALIGTLVGQVDSTWTCTNACVKNSNGAYGEIRIPDRAAILTELGYHDTCDRDADTSHLRDNFFRSACMWGVYKGVCNYFGTQPTYDFYSCEYVSDDLPYTLQPGEVRAVHVTLRNRGVLWKSARNFRLGAIDDSDPFSASNRIDFSGEIGPNQTCTFTFNLTAPATPGYYLTDWQMMREGYAWFGPIISRQIQVGSPPTVFLDEPFESYADQAAFASTWSDTGTSAYALDTATGNPGQSLRMPSPAADGQGRFYRDLPATYVGTDAEPLTFSYDLYLEAAGEPNWDNARHYCELRGYSGGSYNNGVLQNLVAVGLNDASTDTYSTTGYQGRVLNSGAADTQWYTLDSAQPVVPMRSAGWHKMQAQIKTSTINFYVDDQLTETVARPFAAGFNCVVIGSDLTAGGHQVYVDNLRVQLESQPPIITQQPTATSVCAGTSASLSVQAIGIACRYQWQRDGVDVLNSANVSGATTSTLNIGSVTSAEIGNYRCVVFNDAGPTPSTAVALGLRQAAGFTQQPANDSVPMGGSASFSVVAVGEIPLTYQWRRNGVNLANSEHISGVTSATLTIADVRADLTGNYSCMITTPCGPAVSNNGVLSLSTVPGDFDQDGDVDVQDFGHLQACLTGTSQPNTVPSCDDARLDQDTDIDITDVLLFQHCLSGAGAQASVHCADQP